MKGRNHSELTELSAGFSRDSVEDFRIWGGARSLGQLQEFPMCLAHQVNRARDLTDVDEGLLGSTDMSGSPCASWMCVAWGVQQKAPTLEDVEGYLERVVRVVLDLGCGRLINLHAL